MTLNQPEKKRKTSLPMGDINVSLKKMTDEETSALDIALDANGVENPTSFFRECVKAAIIQTKDGGLIAWPPQFVMQDRSDQVYVRDRWSTAQDRISRREKEDALNPAKKKVRKKDKK